MRSILSIALLLLLTSCASGGYARPYIISDSEEAVITEPSEKR